MGEPLLRAGGWFYLAMPQECFDYLRSRLAAANRRFPRLSPEDLQAIGLAFETLMILRQFYPLVVRGTPRPPLVPTTGFVPFAISAGSATMRSIQTLSLIPISTSSPISFSERCREQAAQENFGQIFRNCLESIPFLLKRRRYDPEFLAPTSQSGARADPFPRKSGP